MHLVNGAAVHSVSALQAHFELVHVWPRPAQSVATLAVAQPQTLVVVPVHFLPYGVAVQSVSAPQPQAPVAEHLGPAGCPAQFASALQATHLLLVLQ